MKSFKKQAIKLLVFFLSALLIALCCLSCSTENNVYSLPPHFVYVEIEDVMGDDMGDYVYSMKTGSTGAGWSYYLVDTTTRIVYFGIGGPSALSGISPLYNADGSFVIYEGELNIPNNE